MLLPGSRFDLPFTCTDSTGAATAPTGTPTGVLVQNGTDLGTTVTVTMTGAQGIASCTIPSSGVNAGDRFYIRISAVVSGVTYVQNGPSEAIESPQTLTSAYDAAKTAAPTVGAIRAEMDDNSTKLANLDVLLSTRMAGASYVAPITPPTVGAIRAEMDANSTKLANLDVLLSTRLAAASYVAPPSVAGLATSVEVAALGTAVAALPDAEDIAAEILLDPANKLLTNDDGLVTSTNTSDVLVMPMRSSVAGRVAPNRLDLFVREEIPLEIAILDSRRLPVDCTGLEAEFLTESGEVITGLMPAGTPPHKYTVTITEALTLAAGTQPWSLRVADSTERVLACGVMSVEEVP